MNARIVRSLGHPGRNVTGTIHIAPLPAQLNTLLAYRRIERLGVIYNPAEQNSVLAVEELRSEANRRGLTLLNRPVPLDPAGSPIAAALPGLVREVKARGAEMLYMGPDTCGSSGCCSPRSDQG